MVISWKSFFVLLFFYRCLMSISGQLIISRYTSLGDSSNYHNGVFEFSEFTQNLYGDSIFTISRIYSTILTEMVGAVFKLLTFGSPVLINIGFQSIAFIGIYRLLNSVDGWNRRALALLLLTPSFNLWSSVAGKEALLVFFVGILSAYFVKLYENRAKLGILEFISAIGVFLFKFHYLPAIATIYLVLVAGRLIKQRVVVVLVAGLASLALLYFFRDQIDEMAFSVAPHFLGYGSSREAYWITQYDVFYKAPYGMFQGFFGPTFVESTHGILQKVSFVESSIIVVTLLFLLVRNLANLPVFSFLMGTISLGWILFASYPLGILNAGSAIRYRTGHFLLVFIIFAVILSRSHYIRWQKGRSTELMLRNPPTVTQSNITGAD